MKLEKQPFVDEEIDRILNEIPNATSSLAAAGRRHHPAPPFRHPAGTHFAPRGTHLSPAMTSSPSDLSPPSPTSPLPPFLSELDLLSRLQAMQIRADPNPYPYPSPVHAQQTRYYPNPNPYPIRSLYPSYEDSFILDGRRANGGGEKRRGNGSGMAKVDSLTGIQGSVYHIAKDQNGCRLLQRMFDGGRRQDVDLIFKGVMNHVAELMMNPFGNYLMQKLLDVCTEEQRLRIVLELTADPWEIIRVSVNTHG